ncbi:NADH:flavin oxidoreductase/NADH oxidase-like protein [Apiospora hydei]|uniref:NADH:flavin oxidoreductase/NADH oxidase-like protein n=1 Tax=Apiospora hydei TaxID=1337664 RepID=A0ABR1WB87_9PEZI
MVSATKNVATLADTPDGGKPRFEAFRALAAAANADGVLVLGQVAHPDGQLFARICKGTVAPSVIHVPAHELCGSYMVTREAIPWRHRPRHYELRACHRRDMGLGKNQATQDVVLRICGRRRGGIEPVRIAQDQGLHNGRASIFNHGGRAGHHGRGWVGQGRGVEPCIARNILEGCIWSAKRPGERPRGPGTQLTWAAKGEEPFDASDEEMAKQHILHVGFVLKSHNAIQADGVDT